MTWYQQSHGLGDTHLGTVTRGKVYTKCGMAFRICAACCGVDYGEWLCCCG
jgi:hypothetical protein